MANNGSAIANDGIVDQERVKNALDRLKERYPYNLRQALRFYESNYNKLKIELSIDSHKGKFRLWLERMLKPTIDPNNVLEELPLDWKQKRYAHLMRTVPDMIAKNPWVDVEDQK